PESLHLLRLGVGDGGSFLDAPPDGPAGRVVFVLPRHVQDLVADGDVDALGELRRPDLENSATMQHDVVPISATDEDVTRLRRRTSCIEAGIHRWEWDLAASRPS